MTHIAGYHPNVAVVGAGLTGEREQCTEPFYMMPFRRRFVGKQKLPNWPGLCPRPAAAAGTGKGQLGLVTSSASV